MKAISRGKSEFIAKSAMTFAQFIGTAGLATKLFGEFSLTWRFTLTSVMAILIILALAMYPNQSGSEE